ncbi:MAG TPA: LAGLIDADG family homing endonuclease [Nitrososphaerales archaeon]|nr:LAGLIDADG family homing endonuclease [Nitrososphaerales archaeon]
MSDHQDGHLAWPPIKEDLERFYLVQGLSAAKIAKAYGLKYKSPKVAESTILYQLKKNGINRRDKAEHIRRVTGELVDRWVSRYVAGESLKQIAENEFSPVTVYLYLHKRGIKLRDKVEAQIQAVTKCPKIPFTGGVIERAYLVGFTKGDCQVTRHGRAIRVRTSTTHPAMADLFSNLFGIYGFVQRYPRESKLVGYEWSLEVDLDQSFEFLNFDFKNSLEEFGRSPVVFLSFLSGFFDAEGSIYFHKKRKGGAFEISITNTNVGILVKIQSVMALIGHYSKFETNVQDELRLGYLKKGTISKIRVWRQSDVIGLLKLLNLRHAEKIAKAEIALTYQLAKDPEVRANARKRWTENTKTIAAEKSRFVEDARLSTSRKDR